MRTVLCEEKEGLSFKVEIKRLANWQSNRLRFATRRQAEDYARSLQVHWHCCLQWRVIPTNDEVFP